MKRLILVLTFVFGFLLTNPVPTAAYYAGFDDYAPGTLASSIALEGVHFSGADWLIRDMSVTGLYPDRLSGNALRGCYSTLTISFDQPQRVVGFNFMFNTAYTNAYTVTVAALSEGTTVDTGNYRGQLPAYWVYPEGYALLSSGDPFDTLTINHNAAGFCLYIDQLSTATERRDSRLGQVYVTVPGTLLYDQAGGGIVRDDTNLEMRIPNQSAPDPWYDTYNVIDQAVVGGQVWLQIFVGDMTDYPWIPMGPNTWFFLYGA